MWLWGIGYDDAFMSSSVEKEIKLLRRFDANKFNSRKNWPKEGGGEKV